MARKSVNDFKVFKTITIGTFRSANALRTTLKTAGVVLDKVPNEILLYAELGLASTETELDLVKLMAPQVGFMDGGRYDRVSERALECGLQLCPAEVGPQLRLQYLNQGGRETAWIVMKPIVAPDGSSGIFVVGRDIPLVKNRVGDFVRGKPSLYLGFSTIPWESISKSYGPFIFVRPRTR